jgi:hypothetical protein
MSTCPRSWRDSSKFELGTFADALDTVSDAIGARLGVMGP